MSKYLVWREVKVLSGSSRAICEHFTDSSTRCYLKGRGGGKSIDLELYRSSQALENGANGYWFRESFDIKGNKISVEYISQDAPESLFFDKKFHPNSLHEDRFPLIQKSNRSTWWKWFLVIWILAVIGRTLSPSGPLNKKVRDAEREAEVLLNSPVDKASQ